MQITHAEAEMVGVAWSAAGLLLAVVHRDVPDAEATQRNGGRKSGRSAADDCDPTIAKAHGATLHPVRLHSSAWQ